MSEYIYIDIYIRKREETTSDEQRQKSTAKQGERKWGQGREPWTNKEEEEGKTRWIDR